MSKSYQKLPIHIVEYHNEALEHIYKAIGSKHLPFGGNVLLHFDAHPDMIIPDILARDVFDKDKLLSLLSIENWITPALYAGHFDCVLWMKADWAEQIADGNYHFKIGCHRNDAKIRVSLPDDYFLSECLYCNENDMDDAKDVSFFVKTCQEGIDHKELGQFRDIIENKPYILDIDLDYFSTKNPIKTLIGEDLYHRLKAVYEFKSPKTRNQNNINRSLDVRKNDLIAFKAILTEVERGSTNEWTNHPMFEELRYVYQSCLKNLADEIDAELLHEFGCTTDDPELPHHISTESEIISLLFCLEKFVTTLEKPPTMVTISRSSVDEYCPSDQVEHIQKLVLDKLQHIFKDIEIFYHYKEE